MPNVKAEEYRMMMTKVRAHDALVSSLEAETARRKTEETIYADQVKAWQADRDRMEHLLTQIHNAVAGQPITREPSPLTFEMGMGPMTNTGGAGWSPQELAGAQFGTTLKSASNEASPTAQLIEELREANETIGELRRRQGVVYALAQYARP